MSRRQRAQQYNNEAILNDLNSQVAQKRKMQEQDARREKVELLQHYENSNIQYAGETKVPLGKFAFCTLMI